MEDLLRTIRGVKTYKQMYDVPWKTMMDKKIKISSFSGQLRIALICHPCFGNGDVIFAVKMHRYIKDWYGIDSTILTPKPFPFIENGIKHIYCLKKPESKTYVECENLRTMKIYNIDKSGKPTTRAKIKHTFDLIMVTPWIGTDFEPNKNIIKNFLPYANSFNTILFSEYNPSDPKKYDFATGIGKGLCGLLITKMKFVKTIQIKNPYLMVHLTRDDRVDVGKCFSNFIKLMCKKYHKKHDKLDVVIPSHVLKDKKQLKKLFDYIKKRGYYTNVLVQKEKQDTIKTDKSTLTIRADVSNPHLPLDQFTSLFKNCLPDVLITGDQSVTDIISNCDRDYNIHYQVMPWKTNFAKGLAQALGQNYIGKVSTSCGLESFSTKLRSNTRSVAKNYNFVQLGKPKLDAILAFAMELRKNKDMQEFVDIVLHSRTRSSVISKIKKYIE